VLFPTHHIIEALKATISHLQNVTAILVENINKAVAEAMTFKNSDNRTVQDYSNDLNNNKNNESENFT
jgi:hypothetical protein